MVCVKFINFVRMIDENLIIDKKSKNSKCNL